MTLSPADHERLRARLLSERERVLRDIDYNEGEIEALQDQTGAEHQDEGPGGGASFTLDREIDRALDENDQRILQAIEESLQRIDDGTYGTCANCGKSIDPHRLEARPYAALCIGCA